MEKLDKRTMKLALEELDRRLKNPLLLIMGGGGAMVLAYQHPLATFDIDAIPKGLDILELDILVKSIAEKLKLPPQWLNPYFSTYAHTLPADYGHRLVEVLKGKWLTVRALGKEDLLIMKCFAHRQKDVGHARALLKKGVDLLLVENHIENLKKMGIPKSQEALDFLDDLKEL